MDRQVVLWKTRLALVALLAVGIMLHFLAMYAAFHPHLLVSKILLSSMMLYLLAAPIALWRMRRCRVLAGSIFGIWFLYVGLFCFAVYQTGRD